MRNSTKARKADLSSASETDMAQRPVRVLLVEDDEDDYRLTRDLLREIGERRFVLEWVPSYAAAVEVMPRQEHDVYLVDYRLGPHDGLELLNEPFLVGKPVIMLTGLDDRDVDLKAMAAGAADFLVKGKIDAPLLERSIRYAIERKRAEEALKEADRRKDEFLAMLGHELRNPLAPILNAVQVLQLQKGGNSVQQKAQAIIKRQVGQLTHLVDDLMDVSRITSGRIQLRRERIDVSSIVERAVETARPLIDQRQHELTVSLPPDPIWLNADSTRIEQIVTNLLTNAIKYTDEGGHIWLAVQQEGDRVMLRVRDTGLGITPAFLPHVFDLFTQAERSTDRSQGGLGIGLALVKRLVEMHEGTIGVSSTFGEGSEFVVSLAVDLPMVLSQKTQPPPTEIAKPPSAALRVLVVDDNLDAATALELLLQASGHLVRLAHTGPTGLAAALDFRPDVVLLDIGLPELDGWQVAKRLRQQPILHDIVLVAMTGYGQNTDRQRSQKAGFDHHFVKPVDFGELRQILAAVSERAVQATERV
jgi:signal transduction histidine kinase